MVSGESGRAALPRRGRWLALLALATVLLHASLLDGLAGAWRGHAALPAPAAVQVRLLAPAFAELPDVLPDELPPPAALPVAEPPPRALPPRRARAEAPVTVQPLVALAVAPAVARPWPEPVAPAIGHDPEEPLPEPGYELVAAQLQAQAPAEARGARAAAPTPQAERPDPTRLPPPLTLDYDLRRGALRGSAELRWQPREGGYDLGFDARVAGFSVLRQSSSGELGEAGLAPRRFTDQRAGREVRATNFQREAGKITFSGPATEFPLTTGTQDRLSWMVQLAAVVAADPQRREPGGEVGMTVVGTRADLATWVFRYVGDETVETALGPVAAAKFVRQRRDPYDTEVEVWLDPANHHLPARALLHNGPNDTLELLLRRAS